MAYLILLIAFLASQISTAISLSIDTSLPYVFSSIGRGGAVVLYGQSVTNMAYVITSNVNSAGDGAQWLLTYDSSNDSYTLANKVFPKYQMDIHPKGRPYLSPADDSVPTQKWKIDNWPDGTYKLWRECCDAGRSLAAPKSGLVVNMTEGNDDLHHWLMKPVANGTDSTTATDSGSASSGGLSVGAKAGIGVGVGVGVLILVAVAGVAFWVHKRRQRRGGIAMEPPPPQYASAKPEDARRAQHLAGTPVSTELSAATPPVELPANNIQPASATEYKYPHA